MNITKTLPGWLRRCGVQRSDLNDVVQEALAAALVKLRERPSNVPMDDAAVAQELMRIVSNVALRIRRQAQREGERYVSFANKVRGPSTGLAVQTASTSKVALVASAQGSTSISSLSSLSSSLSSWSLMMETALTVKQSRAEKPSQAVEPTRATEAPAAAKAAKVETKDLSEEEEARRERWKVWGGTNTPRFDDPFP